MQPETKFVAGSDYPIGVAAEAVEAVMAQFDKLWGSDAMAAMCWQPCCSPTSSAPPSRPPGWGIAAGGGH